MKDFENYIVKITKGFFSDEKIDKIIAAFGSSANNYHFDSEAEANLIRTIDAIIDKIFFLDESLKYPLYTELLVAVASNSNFLCDILVSSPELIYLVLNQNYVLQKISAAEIVKEYRSTSKNFKSIKTKLNFLKSIQRRYLLKIGINDIFYHASINRTTADLSKVAITISKLVFNECIEQIKNKYSLKLFPKNFALCALGKLGGDELNYSSDIDLILFYDDKIKISNSIKSYQELLEEVTKLFINSMSDYTDKGNLYRVDFRLRPDGNYSPLCMSIDEMINYYDSRGDEWERQMLIKLGFVSGNRVLFTEFQKFTFKYIFNSPLPASPIVTIKLMKEKIEKLYSDTENIKTTAGGIRDIEFIVQALQIINGKKYPEIINRNSLESISLLKKYNVLNKKEASTLKHAYIFYRNIEHHLQLMNNLQTHTLYSNKNSLKKLSIKLRFQSTDDFINHLYFSLAAVRSIFNSLTNEGIDTSKDKFSLFFDPGRARNNFHFLSTGVGLSNQKTFDKFTSGKFDLISENIFAYLSNCSFPDRTLDNFVKLTKANSLISSWYSYLNNNDLLNDVLRVCELSQITIDNILFKPELSITSVVNNFFIKQTVDNFVYAQPIFKSILAAQFALEFIDADELTRIYSEFIHTKIRQTVESFGNKEDFFIMSLGSLSVGEMNMFSDIDLIAVAKDYESCSHIENNMIRFLKSIKNILVNIDIDFRLRPEGKNSVLVPDIKNLQTYFENRASVWEFQSMLKNKFIYGSEDLYFDFLTKVENFQNSLSQKRIKLESESMFAKLTSSFNVDNNLGFDIKRSKGGLLTIDFLLSYLLLIENVKSSKRSPRLIDRINLLTEKNYSYENLRSLKTSYDFLKKLLIWKQIFFSSPNLRVLGEEQFGILAKLMNYDSIDKFVAHFDAVIKENISLLNKYL